jgi:UDP-3-O-[3-hydroxymyristoyl] glucosamine N-acyltransferase
MADPRFFQVAGPFPLRRIAEIAGAQLSRASDPDALFTDVAPLRRAGSSEVSFLDNKRYRPDFEASRAGACIVEPQMAEWAPEGMALLETPNPYKAYARVAQAFYPVAPRPAAIHRSAIVDETAELGQDVSIGAYSVVGPGVKIGRDCRIGAQVVIEAGVEIGEATQVGHGSTLSHCLIGRRCLIHPGVRIGNRGFGFALDPEGYVEVPQLGRVIVGDDVEIGANATIDRGAGPDTVVGDGSRIDNLVQIGHNVQLGRGCVLVAQAGVAGSAKLEDHVMIAAQAGVSGHLTMGAGSRLAAKSGLMRDVAPGETVGGLPAMAIKDYFRLVSLWQRQLKAQRKKQ